MEVLHLQHTWVGPFGQAHLFNELIFIQDFKQTLLEYLDVCLQLWKTENVKKLEFAANKPCYIRNSAPCAILFHISTSSPILKRSIPPPVNYPGAGGGAALLSGNCAARAHSCIE